MCGITGYAGSAASLDIVADSLKNLEYRGYDSAGVAVRGEGGVQVYKEAGVIDDLSLPRSSDAHCAIGHTRWSTHGEPTDENAHPHTDCTDRIAVVHNGIIDNYVDLKAELAESHVFTSETDTEVVPHLLEDELREGVSLVEAVVRATDRLEGSYAIAVTVEDDDGIVAARRDSPLVVGHGEDGHFLASDVPAFVEHTREVTFLEDGDVVELTPEDVTVYNDGQRVERERQTVEWDAEAAEKGGYDHYMHKEIHEQPQALRQTISGRIDELNGRANVDVGLPDAYLTAIEELHLVACGTSYHAGLYAAELLEAFTDLSVRTEIASEYEFNCGSDPARTLVVPVTQSGETADTLSALRSAIATGAKTLAVTNTLGSTVTREADDTVYIRAGPEIGVAATKTFVSQVATLGLLIVHLGRVRNELSSERAGEVLGSLRQLPGAVQQILDREPAVERFAREAADSNAFFFVGRDCGHPVSLEGALKLKEISYDHAEGFPAGELKHGPLALVTDETTVLATLTEAGSPEETLTNVKEVQSRGATVAGLSSDPAHEKFLDETFDVPSIGVLEPLLANVYCQLFAYHVADYKDRPIDKPRNLAKSVTVE